MSGIYTLKTGESLTLSDGTDILKVPNGWIYKFYQVHTDGNYRVNYLLSVQFVPDNRQPSTGPR